jgi:hypothetical protein
MQTSETEDTKAAAIRGLKALVLKELKDASNPKQRRKS